MTSIIDDSSPKIELNNYDIHKQLFANFNALPEDKLTTKLSNVGGWFSARVKCKYFMLLCREINYYTVFHLQDMNYNQAVQELKKTLQFRGDILDIIYVHGEDAYECWIKNPESQVEMYYLFPYDWGVVEVV